MEQKIRHNISLGQNIRRLRLSCGLTQEQMEVMTYHNPAWLLGVETR